MSEGQEFVCFDVAPLMHISATEDADTFRNAVTAATMLLYFERQTLPMHPYELREIVGEYVDELTDKVGRQEARIKALEADNARLYGRVDELLARMSEMLKPKMTREQASKVAKLLIEQRGDA